MTINQLAGLTVTLFGIMITLFLAGMGFFKYYLDAKIDPLYKLFEKLDRRDESLNAYVIDHAERIAALESRPK